MVILGNFEIKHHLSLSCLNLQLLTTYFIYYTKETKPICMGNNEKCVLVKTSIRHQKIHT